MRTTVTQMLCLTVFCAMVVGCSNGVDGRPSGPGTTLVSVTGRVMQIRDYVPLDGGVTISIRLTNRETETIYLKSIFTSPPPSEEELQIHRDVYQVILQLEIGDRVTADGVRTDSGIEIKKLRRL